MKQLRAEGIQKLIDEQSECIFHLQRLSRGDAELQERFSKTEAELGSAYARLTEIIDNHRERTDA